MRDYAIEINSLNKYYGENHVLRGINVSITPGEVICVIGGSGSGKSTLLRCINFLEDYSSGSIVVNGECVGYEPLSGEKRRRLSDKENRKALRDVCMVFQQFNLWPHMTVLDNVATPLRRVKKVSREAAYAEAKKQLARVGLADKADSWPAMLSGGQQQRVAIARALTMKPAIMLFDEPTSALDPELVGEVLKVIRNLADDGMTMMIVTHEMGFAAKVSDRVLFLADGCIEEQGPPAQLFHRPKSPRLQYFCRRGVSVSRGRDYLKRHFRSQHEAGDYIWRPGWRMLGIHLPATGTATRDLTTAVNLRSLCYLRNTGGNITYTSMAQHCPRLASSRSADADPSFADEQCPLFSARRGGRKAGRYCRDIVSDRFNSGDGSGAWSQGPACAALQAIIAADGGYHCRSGAD